MESASIPWFLWFFATIGVYALIIALLKFFSAYGSEMRTPHARASDTDPGSALFIEAMGYALSTRTGSGGTARLLNNGDEFYPALFAAMEAAEHSVHIMTYIWRKGRLSDQLFDALNACIRRGVEVRIMMDGLGSLIGPRKQVRAFEAAGGLVGVYNAISFQDIIHINHRNHRRAFVIDGKIAYTGGITIADQWLGHAQDKNHWRDTMVEVTGPMALALQSAFVQLWLNVKGEVLSGPKYYPPPEEPVPNPHLRFLGVHENPSSEVQPLLHFFWYTLYVARTRIYIANAYFAPDRFIRQVLMDKARAGLDVRIMVPDHHIDNKFVRYASQHFYTRFLEAGMRIFEYQGTMMHAKHMAIDGVWSMIGSANIDIRSIKWNQENVLGIADESFARTVEHTFEADMVRCKEITLEAWRRRPWYCKVRERLSVLFKVQY